MKDISAFKDIVCFYAEELTYQAIWKKNHWEMAALDQTRVLEMHDITAPRDATPSMLLTDWWEAQRKAGTYSETHANAKIQEKRS